MCVRASRFALLALAAACGAREHSPQERPAPIAPLRATAAAARTAGMVEIPAGRYVPLYAAKGADDAAAAAIEVAAFRLDARPVTNAEFLEFVRAQPGWQRSRVRSVLADARYLSHWAGDLDLGPDGGRLADAPVTFVSWFAARAYAAWCGKRLPTVAEWEYAAAAGETTARGVDEPGFKERILAWYGKPTPKEPVPVGSTFRNVHGAWDMHGLVWEWVSDFNTALVTGESRGDSGLERDLFCGAGSIGAADAADYAAFMRYAFRSSLKADYAVGNLGFRCALDRAAEATTDSCCEELDAGAVSARSVYQLGSTWTSNTGARINLGELRGEVRVVAMIFTSCEFACPRTLADLQDIAAQRATAGARFLLVTMDTERDTPAVLEAYRAKNGLDPQRWTLLHGEPDDVLDFAAVLGVKFQKAGGTFSHSNVITVLDRAGNIVHQQIGLGADGAPTIAAIAGALAR
jgi:formylglycine-generating enzyme required for sulfatase activity